MRSKGQDRRTLVDLGLHFGYVNRIFSLGNFDRMLDYNNSILGLIQYSDNRAYNFVDAFIIHRFRTQRLATSHTLFMSTQ